MLKTDHLVRGCLVIMLAGCIAVSAGTVFAARLARASGSRPNIVFNLGPLHVGNPCAQLRATYPSIDCQSPYYVVVKVNGAPLWSMEIP
jgi:hypothetical protein